MLMSSFKVSSVQYILKTDHVEGIDAVQTLILIPQGVQL